MIRQQKPAKQTPTMSKAPAMSKASMPKTALGRLGTIVSLFILVAAGTLVTTGTLVAESAALAAPAPPTVQTRTALTQPAGQGTQTVFTAHVTDTTGRALSAEDGAGTVSFHTGALSLGSAIVDGDGTATLTVASLPANADGSKLQVYAVYHPAADAAGTARAAGSVSAAEQVEASATGLPDFTLAVSSASLTVKDGQYATTLVTITPTNGFSEQVTLSCEDLPAQATCNFSPVIASTANGAFTSTLQVQTQAPSGALATPDLGIGRPSHTALAWVLPGMLALAGFASLRRRTLRGSGLLLGLCILVSSLGLSGCSTRYGYIHHPPSVATGTLVGTYTITIFAAGNNGSSVTQHSMPITLQVQ
jgi:hypothetical protein